MRVSAIKVVGDAVEVQAMPPKVDEKALEVKVDRTRTRILAKRE